MFKPLQLLYRSLTLCVAIVTISHAETADPIELAGQYLAAVAMFEELHQTSCQGQRSLWRRNYGQGERWLTTLVAPHEQSEFKKILPELKKSGQAEVKKFLSESFSEIRSKAPSIDIACAHAFGLVAGLAARPERDLLLIEYKRYRRVTAPDKR